MIDDKILDVGEFRVRKGFKWGHRQELSACYVEGMDVKGRGAEWMRSIGCSTGSSAAARCKPMRRQGCGPASPDVDLRNAGLRALVQDYRRECVARVDAEDREMRSIWKVIHHVAFARDENDRCFDHQFRIRRTVGPEAESRLRGAAARIRKCESFDQLHALFRSILYGIFGVNEMYVYDAAQRMGAFLGLKPQKVYLHAGVRKGAKALGVNVRGRTSLEIHELPRALRDLSADHLENFLCIYRDYFRPGRE